MSQTKLHRPQIGVITFTWRERFMLLLRGKLFFLTRKPVEITWTILEPRELRDEAAKFRRGA